jgi:hypothetical protein
MNAELKDREVQQPTGLVARGNILKSFFPFYPARVDNRNVDSSSFQRFNFRRDTLRHTFKPLLHLYACYVGLSDDPRALPSCPDYPASPSPARPPREFLSLLRCASPRLPRRPHTSPRPRHLAQSPLNHLSSDCPCSELSPNLPPHHPPHLPAQHSMRARPYRFDLRSSPGPQPCRFSHHSASHTRRRRTQRSSSRSGRRMGTRISPARGRGRGSTDSWSGSKGGGWAGECWREGG